MCLQQNQITPATVADHVIPHKGDAKLFFEGELQSLCVTHHNATKREQELKGFASDIGNDGFPIDRQNHPFWKAK
jgi:hypothetical protein